MALWDKFIGSHDKDEKRAKELWDRAIRYFEGKLYNRALKDLQDAIELNPAYLEEAIDLMQVFSAQGSDEQALSVGFALLKMDTKNSELMNKLGNSLRKLNSHAKAKKLYTMALKVNPQYTEAKYNLAASSFRISTADSELLRQTKEVEGYTEPRRYGFEGSRAGFFELSNQVLDEEEETPKKSKAGGKEEEEEEQPDLSEEDRKHVMDEMIAELKRDLEATPGSWEAEYNLGLMYDLAAYGEQAIQHYEEAVRIDENHRYSANNLGAALMAHKQDYEGAESILLKNLDRHPFDRTTVLNLAVLYRTTQKSFQRLKYYVYLGDLLAKSLGEFETGAAEAYAEDLFSRRKYLEAIPVFENLALEKQQPYWFEKLTVMYYNQKKEDKLVSTWKRLLKIAPDHAEAQKKLTEMAQDYEKQARDKGEKGSRYQAITLMVKAVKIEETPERWVELAQWYEEEGEEILASNAIKRWKQLTTPKDAPAAPPAQAASEA